MGLCTYSYEKYAQIIKISFFSTKLWIIMIINTVKYTELWLRIQDYKKERKFFIKIISKKWSATIVIRAKSSLSASFLFLFLLISSLILYLNKSANCAREYSMKLQHNKLTADQIIDWLMNIWKLSVFVLAIWPIYVLKLEYSDFRWNI